MSENTANNKGKEGNEIGRNVVDVIREKSEKDDIIMQPNKSDIFELYVLWSSLPAFFKRPPKDRRTGQAPTPREFLEQMGVDDDVMIDLAEIPYQGDFAKRYGVHPDTLTNWNKTIALRDPIADVKAWGKKLYKNVLAAMYSNALSTRNLNADKDRLNFAKMIGWEEKSEVTHRVTGLLDEVKKQIHAREQSKLPSGDNTGRTA